MAKRSSPKTINAVRDLKVQDEKGRDVRGGGLGIFKLTRDKVEA